MLRVPKSLGVDTIGSPKWCIQTRLTMTRAVSGFSGAVIACARSSRPLPWENGRRPRPARTLRNCRGTRSPGCDGLPRTKMRGSYSSSASKSTIARGGALAAFTVMPIELGDLASKGIFLCPRHVVIGLALGKIGRAFVVGQDRLDLAACGSLPDADAADADELRASSSTLRIRSP